MVEIRVERTIAAPPQKVFDWLADPANLTAAPLALKAGFAEGSAGPAVGAQRWLIGVGMWFREEITAYDPPNSYSYRIIGAFPSVNHQGGSMVFTPAEHGTHVDWRSAYTHPAYAGGKLTQAVSAPLLRSSFEAILAGCGKALER